MSQNIVRYSISSKITHKKYNKVVDNAIPTVWPKFLTNEFTLPTIPSLSLGHVDIISALFAGWNIACPTAIVATDRANKKTGEVSVNLDIKKNPKLNTNNPIKITFSDDTLSEILPNIGEQTANTRGDSIINKPA